MWDPNRYLTFVDNRSRPWFELLARVPHEDPERVVDLGCGAGNLTASLTARWSRASVVGVDASSAMIERARADGGTNRVAFVLDDLRRWEPSEPVDVVVSNAALHWIPDHLDLLARFVGWLRPGGCVAFQVPGNFDAPSHVLLRDLARRDPWRHRLRPDPAGEAVSHSPETYASRLLDLGMVDVDAWETTYLQHLAGRDAVYEWMLGTALRPYLARLPEPDRERFLGEYRALVTAAYPKLRGRDLTVFAFRRVFAVACRP